MATDTIDKKIPFNTEYELKENASVNLKITIPGDELKKEYEEIVKEYCASIQIKGFRKGKVPRNVLETKFGDTLKGSAVQSVMEKVLDQAFQDAAHKPLPYARPEIKAIPEEVTIDKDYSFEVVYDSYPEITLGKYKGIELEKKIVEISNDDLQNELDILRNQNAIVKAKEDGTAIVDNIITIDYVEIDAEGKEIASTKRENFSFTLGSGKNLYKIDNEILGMKVNEEKQIEKTFPDDFEYKELAGKKVTLKVKLQAVKEKQLPGLDDELAQDISDKYKTLNDLKTDITEKLKAAADERVRSDLIEQMLMDVVKSSVIPVPKSMAERELQYRWRLFLSQYRMNEKLVLQMMEKNGKTKESILEDLKPKVEESIRSSLVVEKILEIEKIEVSDEEIANEYKKIADQQNRNVEEIKSYYEQNKIEQTLKDGIARNKLFDMLILEAKVKKGKKVSYADIVKTGTNN